MVRNRRHVCQLCLIEILHNPPNATLWTRIKNRIRSLTTISRKHPYTNLLFRSNHSLTKELIRHTRSDLWFSIHPYSLFWYVWSILMMFIYILVFSMDIFKQTVVEPFPVETTVVSVVAPVYNCFNTIYIINIVLNFFTGYVESKTVIMYEKVFRRITTKTVVLEKGKIAENYFKTFLLFDMIAFEELFANIYAYYFGSTKIFGMISLRLLRIIRFRTATQTVRMITIGLSDRLDIHNLFLCGFSAVFTLFFAACVQLGMPHIFEHFTKQKFEGFPSHVRSIYKKTKTPLSRRIYFITALHKVTCNFVGFPVRYVTSNFPENLIRYVLVFIGTCHRAWYLCIIIPIGKRKYESWLRYRDFSKSFDPYLAKIGTSNRFAHDFKIYFRHYLESEMFEEGKILSNLNNRMKFEIFSLSSMDLIKKCHMFDNISNKIISSLAALLKYETYTPGQMVIKYGDAATCMYFIATGEVAVYSGKGFEYCHLSDGDYFGEMGLLSPKMRRKANVITIEETILYRLDAAYFNIAIKPRSQMYSRLQRKSEYRLSIISDHEENNNNNK